MSDDLHFLQLPELEQVSAPDATSSCFHKLEICEHLSLLPCFVGRLSQGISEHLNKKLLRYSEHYGGVLLAYTKPCVQQTLGRILDEQPHIHFDLVYTAYVFRPVIGSVVCGTVNNVGGDHVGCLVYDCFNASVFSKSQQGKGSKRLNGTFTSKFLIGSKIWFQVVSTDNISGVLSIIGEYFDPRVLSGEKQDCVGEPQSPLPLDSSIDATALSGEDRSDVHLVKQKKRKAKRAKERKEDISLTTSQEHGTPEKILPTFPLNSSMLAIDDDETSAKKRRKHTKQQLEEESRDTSQVKEDIYNEASFCSDSSADPASKTAEKKKKKRRRKVKVEGGLTDSSQNADSGGEMQACLHKACSIDVTPSYSSEAGTVSSAAEKRKVKRAKKVKRTEGVSGKDASQHDGETENVTSAAGKNKAKSVAVEFESVSGSKKISKKRHCSDISTETSKKKKKLTIENCQVETQHKRKR